MRKLIWSARAGLLALAAALALHGAPPRETLPRTAERRTAAMGGRELYLAYCASCHGMEGRGDGPAAEAMRMRPTDLTLLRKTHGGSFPKARIERLLGGLEGFPAHGGRKMPVWGPVFIPVSPADGHSAALIDPLVRYLESIQQPEREP
jgi:mono/diheme cytochrome c family protein